ncbi:MAG TPA: hypothetical protein VGE74_10625 [Gemmata sp.]
MPDNFISGNNSYVKLGSLSYSFSKWRLPIDSGNKKFFAFGSQAQRTLPGGYAATPVCDGPYNAGNMPLSAGVVYELHLGFAPGVELVVNARVANIEYSAEITAGGDPAQCSVTFDSHGEFSISYT